METKKTESISNADKLFANANAGFNAFEAKMLEMSKQQIFNNAYEINAKNEIHGYLCDCAAEELEEDEVAVLVALGEEIIEELYDYFSETDNASIMYYHDISEWVHDFCEEAMKNEV